MRNGSYSIALRVHVRARPSSLKGRRQVDDLGRAALAGRLAVRAVRSATCRSPPTLAPVSTKQGVDVYDVDIKEGLAEILPGFETPIYGYEGVYPGPTIRARKGRTAIVRQKNRLAFDSNVHLHGGYVPAAHDGHPMDVIQPGHGLRLHVPERAGRGVPLVPRPRPRAHGADALLRPRRAPTCSATSARQELELPQGEYDVPLVIADHAFNKDGSFRYAENVDLGFRGDTILVNGAVSPRMAVERRLYRLRFLNASNARSYNLQARQRPHDAADRLRRRPARARRVARPASRCTRPSGSRCCVDFRSFKPGSEIVLQNIDGESRARRSGHALRRRRRRRRRGGADPDRAHAHAGEAARSRTRAAAGTCRC